MIGLVAVTVDWLALTVPAVAVAVKTAAVSAPEVAFRVSAFSPAVGPSVQLPTVATPLVPLVAGLPVTLPPSLAVNVTTVPLTGLLN